MLLLPKIYSYDPIFRRPRRQPDPHHHSHLGRNIFHYLNIGSDSLLNRILLPERWPRPQNRYLEEFTNYDLTKDVLDIKSIDHENKIIHYYQYRNDPHDCTPEPALPKTSRFPQQTTITIDGKETIIDASPEEIISTMMDQVDYNEMLDFYGDPELR